MAENGADKQLVKQDPETSNSSASSQSIDGESVPGLTFTGNVLVQILQGTFLEVDPKGEIVGPKAEGTLGIVLHAVGAAGLRTEIAVRLPRLLQSDILLNFHVAEIVFHESRQAHECPRLPGVLRATNFFRLEDKLKHKIISKSGPDPKIPDGVYFIGFYLSPTLPYQVCLVWENDVWPENLRAHLKTIDKSPEDLFKKINTECEASSAKSFNKLLSMPNRTDQASKGRDDDSFLDVVGREDLDTILANRELGRWWFNIPVATYDWMTASLERLLTGYVDSNEGETSASLRTWALSDWFDLLSTLALGLRGLHQAGFIHGDPRPANIMTNVQAGAGIQPKAFYWIDIGLGYGANDVPADKAVATQEEKAREPSSITPRPLGGGRTTIFYAPERDEASEFEDADMVKLRALNENHSKLEFSWRKQTNLGALPLPLVEIETDGNGKEVRRTPLRELGKLVEGDRVQVREFLFEVEKVEEDGIVISRIFEIFLERVLVEKKGDERTRVYRHLDDAPISRYRIFQQWSQATDVYGLGIITLYVFFIRGLYELKSEYNNDSERNPIYDRANREVVFEELAVLLRNRSFLERLLFNIKNNGFDDPGKLWKAELKQSDAKPAQASEAFENISKVILLSDYNFEFVWHGVDQNHQLFVLVIYFCLCCIWRQQEVDQMQIEKNTGFPFKAFSKSRLVVGHASKHNDNPDIGGATTISDAEPDADSDMKGTTPTEDSEGKNRDTTLAAASSKADHAMGRLIRLLPEEARERRTDKKAKKLDRGAGGFRADQLIELRQKLDEATKLFNEMRQKLETYTDQVNQLTLPIVMTQKPVKKWIEELDGLIENGLKRFSPTAEPGAPSNASSNPEAGSQDSEPTLQ
jgi:serine/threonine protein kinase